MSATIDQQERTLCEVKTMRLIHYGADRYNPAKFKPICDHEWVKPNGGLWTSPVGSEFGWLAWCHAETFNVESLDKFFTLQFSGRVLQIDSVADLDKLVWAQPLKDWHVPLFEPLVFLGVDAIHLTVNGQWKTRHSRPRNLYGWDCESVLVMNPDCISTL